MVNPIDIIKRIRLSAKILLGKDVAGRNVTIFPDDIFIVSYPKSGNTWIRFLIGSLVYDQPINFANIERKVPDIYQNNDEVLLNIPRPRLLKSHECFDPNYKKVIYIVRDPRDVAISYYHHHIKFKIIEDNYPIDRFVLRFISGGLNPFGSWGENVGSWFGMCEDNNDFMPICYEDILEDPFSQLRKIASFLNIAATEERLNNMVDLYSAQNMRRMEVIQSDLWKPTKNTRKDKYFVRNGKAGSWRDELPKPMAEAIQTAWSKLMMKIGYC